jgi:hypothetical protein
VQCRPGRALPRDRLLVEELDEQVDLLVEEHLVVTQVVAEERKRLGEGAAPEDHLGAPVRQRVDGREALEDADRVVGAEHGHPGGQVDARGLRRDPGEYRLGGRDRELGAVVLAHRDDVKAGLIGDDSLGDDPPDRLRVRDDLAAVVPGQVPEGVDAELDGVHPGLLNCGRKGPVK